MSSDIVCDDTPIEVRLAGENDRMPLAQLFAAVAEERDGIAAEPPIDVERWAARFDLENTFVAVDDGRVVGSLSLYPTPFGHADLGMFVAREQRGRGIGSALIERAIDVARARGFHKLVLGVFPHNEAAIALYRKFGFVEEGLRREHIRRQSGEYWDLIDMALLLETSRPSAS